MPPNSSNYLEIAHQRATEKKTHVSFPQLKYPSLRDTGSKHPTQWLAGKALDDGAEGLWRIHNGLYDFKEFVDKHPGGAEWLELSKGTDITEAFEAHHINASVEKILNKFYIRDAKTPRNSPFTFKDDGFYRTLKRAVREELKKIPTEAYHTTDKIIDSLLAALFISSALSCWLDNYVIAYIMYLTASLSFAWVTVASHNYIHRKNNWRMYLFNISLWSYRDFRISHALSHHLYPNTLMDLEISAFEPIVNWNPRHDKLFHKFTFLVELVVFPFVCILNFINRLNLNFQRAGWFIHYIRWDDAVGLILPLWIYLVSGKSFTEAILAWIWILCTGSFIFAIIGTGAAHHHPKIFKDGDEVREPTVDWGMHNLEAVMDRKDISGNIFKVLTHFGDHALHHLFPTLDHGVLEYLKPVFLEHVKKFGANFRLTSSLDLFIGQIQSTMKKDPNTLASK